MIGEKVQEVAAPVQVDAETGRRRKGKAVSGYTEMFGALKETFPDDVIRRLLRAILTSRIAPLAEEGDIEGYQEELEAIAQEAYEGAMEANIKSLDDRLRDFYHIGDVYYEQAGQGTVDYGKLQRSIGLPNDVINHMRAEEMEYEEALEYLSELARGGFERQHSEGLTKLVEYLHGEATKVATTEVVEARTRGLLEYIDARFPLSPVSAARYADAESGARSSSMMAAEGSSGVVEEIEEQLDHLYGEIEATLAEVFIETNETMPLIAMVDNRLPRSVYRQIESQLGLEKLEEIENTPLAQLEPEVREIVTQAFVRWQESDLLLRVIDYLWTRHLTTMEQLRHSIGLQAYGQKDPLVQYKVKAFELFDDLKAEIRQLSVLNVLMMGGKAEEARAQMKRAAAQSAMEQKARQEAQAGQGGTGKIKGGMSQPRPGQQGQRPNNGRGNGGSAPRPGQPRPGAPVGTAAGSNRQKIGRNDPCWCGSGKKYKMCHGR
jgi:uncharacterized protein YecA (UPF0149 family)